jgi:hypothetical protein
VWDEAFEQTMTDRIRFLSAEVEKLHACECVHDSTVHVREAPEGLPVWDGEVEVFTLMGHPRGQQALAWMLENEAKQQRFVIILAIPPITSPNAAVLSVLRAQVDQSSA